MLDYTLRNPAFITAHDPFKEELKVLLVGETLVEKLVKIVNVNGNIETAAELRKREESGGLERKKKPMSGQSSGWSCFDPRGTKN